MNVPAKLAAFALALLLAGGGAALAGAAIDPTDEAAVVSDAGHGAAEPAASNAAGHGERIPAADGDAGHAEGDAAGHDGAAELSGLAVSDGAYALDVDRTFLPAGETVPFTFRINDSRGRVVREEFAAQHEKELHLIVVRRDTAVFEHLHPRKSDDGTWSVDLNLREPGVYRAYADFKIGGEKRTLATDLFAPGAFEPQRLPAPASTAPAGDLDVTLDAPGVRAGRETTATFTVTRDGRPFERLEPYLGAKGHLVALREGDLAYLHVHPTEGGDEHAHDDGSTSTEAHGNEIAFAANFPTPGRYRLFLQFKTGGDVRTAAFTLEVPR